MTVEQNIELSKLVRGYVPTLDKILAIQNLIAQVAQQEYDKGFNDGQEYGRQEERR